MAPFVVAHDTRLSPTVAWERLTDWPRHGEFVPLTTITVSPPGPSAVGTVFTARTGAGRVGFDDPMEIVEWEPPQVGTGGHCRLEKRGRAMLGWAVLTVVPYAAGSRVTWEEDVRPAHLPRFAEKAAAAPAKLLFGRVLRRLLED